MTAKLHVASSLASSSRGGALPAIQPELPHRHSEKLVAYIDQ